jgi:tRNA (guanine37-N1)-methyltransferase
MAIIQLASRFVLTAASCYRNVKWRFCSSPSGYESVGHIVHLNLREEHQPYKNVIGVVLLDKLKPRIRTIVNKTESTGGPYRTFAMEVLAGDPTTETSLRENGCTFHLDFSKVYWNSRLDTEHGRIVNSLKSNDILADAFCGIGPFALPAFIQRKCKVYANDLNPMSVEYLKVNAKANGVSIDPGSGFNVSCSCARDFLRNIVRDKHIPITRVVMNFPSGAPEFLDIFCGLYGGLEDMKLPMPIVNCYCFVRGDDWEADAKMRVQDVFEAHSDTDYKSMDLTVEVREVRDVAPKKRHVCLTFKLPEAVAFGTRTNASQQRIQRDCSPSSKRPRLAAT